MTDLAIRVEGLGKRYLLGAMQESYASFRDALADAALRPVRALQARVRRERIHKVDCEILWALKDVSFDVGVGEVVGIIGRNGAGKSTLLKILSRITEPTLGSVDIHGRVSSLLEVGTGFHPELTGRENVYLNGAILGMKRREIERNFDEIVAFAEVESFIDTPVKRYSSGMYLRLAIAVAAHLEPEVLVIDEVLAVGDAAFQQKCLGKMDEVSKQGRTVLFVSHNMAAVSNLCRSAYWLDRGGVLARGPVHEVVSQYLQSVRSASVHCLRDRVDRYGSGAMKFTRAALRNSRGEVTDIVQAGEAVVIELDYVSDGAADMSNVSVSITFTDQMGGKVFCCWSEVGSTPLRNLGPMGTFVCRIPRLPLAPGIYYLTLALGLGWEGADKVSDAVSVTVVEGDFFGTGKLPPPHLGSALVDHDWTYQAMR
jgi:lipopolysaccharide transport system ATP-binding protein